MARGKEPTPRLAPLGSAPALDEAGESAPRRLSSLAAARRKAAAGITVAAVALSSAGFPAADASGEREMVHLSRVLAAAAQLQAPAPEGEPSLSRLSRIPAAASLPPPAPEAQPSLSRLSRIPAAAQVRDDPAPQPVGDPPVEPVEPAEPAEPVPVARLSGLNRLPTSVPAESPPAGPDPRLPGLSRLSADQVPPPGPPAPETPPEPVVPADAGALPLGKGMWLYVTDQVEGGNVDALIDRARHVGLTHIYVRTGSSKSGFYAQPYLDQLLQKAHASGLRVIGWDFPYLYDVGDDVGRAMAAITYTTPDGHRIDGFAADIETRSEGTNLTPEGAGAYGHLLREAAGPRYPLVAVVPRPSSQMQRIFPYAEVLPPFDAVAPMTYWLNRQPDSDVVNDVTFLLPFGKPVIPVGQAYDGAPEGGRPGPPPPDEIARFLAAAEASGAVGASFWSWQHASQPIWDTIAAAPQFRWEALAPGELRLEQVRALQAQLTSLGHPVAATGSWDDLTSEALRAYQGRALLPQSGVLDPATLDVLLRPFGPPIGPVT
ncbi:MAG TPA: peptidoglycan-binding domain-containing protein [Acidimicrobiales bacterium]|nr:peptidoglycan-binding domain-containing protein [Acidimicrobiales bacterium]